MPLQTVEDFVGQARVLLQDTIVPFRYSTEELIEALNEGLLESRRLRPDFYLNKAVPSYSESNLSEVVDINEQYKVSFIYYMAGNAHLRDEEDTQDARATVFLNKFISQLQATKS